MILQARILFWPVLFCGTMLLGSCQSPSADLHRIPLSDVLGEDSAKFKLVDYDPDAFPFRPVKLKEGKDLLMVYAERSIFKVRENEVSALVFEAGMAVDADGAPKAYHPQDIGLDALEHAGKPGDWWALATDTGLPSGTPVVQGPNDPAPGYFVSMTSLSSPDYQDTDPRKYVDASKIAYLVLPPSVRSQGHATLGDIAAVYYRKTNRLVYAILADSGPEGKIGEGSMALANSLGISDNPRMGGVRSDVIYTLFPGSGNGLPKTQEEIDSRGQELLQKWGGLQKMKETVEMVEKKKEGLDG